MEQMGKDLNKAREAYFAFIQTQEKKIARTKHTTKKEDSMRGYQAITGRRVPKKEPRKSSRKKKNQCPQ